MKSKETLTIILAISLILGSYHSFSQTAEELFPKGIQLEEVKGELGKAIEVYQTIVTKFSANRPISSKALFHIGLCYEKLGDAQAREARKAYERVVRDYADQSEIVALVRKRLVALGGTNSSGGLVTCRVLADASSVKGVLTPDGKYISYIDRKTGDIIQYEVSSGQTSRITNRGPVDEYGDAFELPVFSRDGKQVAYASYKKDWGPQVRIRNLDGSGLRTLYSVKSESSAYVLPLDWMPDAGSILVLRRRNPNESNEVIELTLISTADSSVRVLRTITADYPLNSKARLSPDGRFVAFSSMSEGNQPNGDIFLMTADGRNEVVIALHPAEDQLLGWTPDGRSLVFLSDRSGTWDIWTVHITEGKQQGEPELLKKDFGYYSEVLGFAPDGSCYYKTVTPLGGLYSGTIDIETGKVLVPPVAVTTRYTGPPSEPKWSPDGRSLLYLGSRGPDDYILTIRSAVTGEERFLTPPRSSDFSWPSWTPDGRSIIALWITATETGIFRIDTETSATTKLAGIGLAPKLCPDGKTLVFVMDGARLMKKRNLDTGEESEVVKTGSYRFDLSPDGREVVYQVDGAVKIVSINGGEPRELFSGLAKNYRLEWTRDGRYVIAQSGSKIWRVPAQGGTPLKLDLSVPKMQFFTLHPDNSHFALTINEGSKSELWVMENFLPK